MGAGREGDPQETLTARAEGGPGQERHPDLLEDAIGERLASKARAGGELRQGLLISEGIVRWLWPAANCVARVEAIAGLPPGGYNGWPSRMTDGCCACV